MDELEARLFQLAAEDSFIKREKRIKNPKRSRKTRINLPKNTTPSQYRTKLDLVLSIW